MNKFIKLWIFLLAFCEFNIVYGSENKIVFWDYNSELNYEFLQNNDWITCKKKFPKYISLDLKDFVGFNEETFSFIFKYDEHETRRLIKRLDDQFDKSVGGWLFYSIVIDGNIVLNGFNRIPGAFQSASTRFVANESGLDLPIIDIFPQEQALKLSMIFSYYDDEPTPEDKANIDIRKIKEYFNKRNKLFLHSVIPQDNIDSQTQEVETVKMFY